MNQFWASCSFGVAGACYAMSTAPSLMAAVSLGGTVGFGVWNAISALKEKS